MPTAHSFLATAPRGMVTHLAAEIRDLGVVDVKESGGVVKFSGTLADAYRVCLWSRLANRVLLPIASFLAADAEALYSGIHELPWEEHLAADGTLAVDFDGASADIRNSLFGAQRVKDAVVDRFRDRTGGRPSVDVARPALRLNVVLHRGTAEVRIDLSGESLHRRGYRQRQVAAPLKENLAAGILVRAGWPEIARARGPFLDPLCGSGTLPIEAALMAGDVAPGLTRASFGFLRWPGHDAAAWEALLAEARERREKGLRRMPPIVGTDGGAEAVSIAIANVERAGLRGHVHIERRELADLTAAAFTKHPPGLVAANPPYGERLSDESSLRPLYEQLGERLRTEFTGWRAAIFTGTPGLVMRTGIRAKKSLTLWNGPIECRLFIFDVAPEHFLTPGRPGKKAVKPPPEPLSPGAESFFNRLRKDLKLLGAWARREEVTCWRLYDADIPEYAVAVDFYERYAHVQEYEPPATVDAEKSAVRLREVMAVVPDVLGIPPEQVFLKVRRRQKGGSQYEKQAKEGIFYEVREGGLKFLVNLTDYLDTGLFLDHRPTRALIRSLAAGKRFLNLYGYTGSATVYAAAAGATGTVTVDTSATYLEWARRNLELNGFTGPRHRLLREDCLPWLENYEGRYGLIFLDPPTFSRGKRMEEILDIRHDHVRLIQAAARRLEPDGVLIFSCNFRRFKMDTEALPELVCEDITRQTIPRDFERNPRIHTCWKITHRP